MNEQEIQKVKNLIVNLEKSIDAAYGRIEDEKRSIENMLEQYEALEAQLQAEYDDGDAGIDPAEYDPVVDMFPDG